MLDISLYKITVTYVVLFFLQSVQLWCKGGLSVYCLKVADYIYDFFHVGYLVVFGRSHEARKGPSGTEITPK